VNRFFSHYISSLDIGQATEMNGLRVHGYISDLGPSFHMRCFKIWLKQHSGLSLSLGIDEYRPCIRDQCCMC